MAGCIFCKIIKGEIQAEIEKETEKLLVFKDLHPKAQVHLLIVPKIHIQDIRQVPEDIWIEIKEMAIELAKEKKLRGFRLVHNAGDSALVSHMHVHFLGEVSKEREV